MRIHPIIVTYNGEQLIRDCLNSLRESTVELKPTVIDNASSDRTADIIEKEYPEVRLIKNPKNEGFGRANNQGMRIALQENADYVFLLNQDATVEPDTIEKLVNAHKQNPEYGILSPLHLSDKKDEFDPRFGALLYRECKEIYYNAFFNKTQKEIYDVSFVNAAAWLLPRKTLETVGGFNPLFFMYGEDTDYCRRALFHNYRIGIYKDIGIIHSRISMSKTKSDKRKYETINNNAIKYLDESFNLNYSLTSLYKKHITEILDNIFCNLWKLKLVRVYKYFEVLINLLSKYKRINENRKISRSGIKSFLK